MFYATDYRAILTIEIDRDSLEIDFDTLIFKWWSKASQYRTGNHSHHLPVINSSSQQKSVRKKERTPLQRVAVIETKIEHWYKYPLKFLSMKIL
jgi:hypothetical protein